MWILPSHKEFLIISPATQPYHPPKNQNKTNHKEEVGDPEEDLLTLQGPYRLPEGK
jgi:hypothetical protein